MKYKDYFCVGGPGRSGTLAAQMALVDDLRQMLHEKPTSVVWVVGTGVPLGALHGTPWQRYAAWDGLLRGGLHRIHELGKITIDELADYERMLGHDRLTSWLMVASAVEDGLGAPTNGEFLRWLRETVGEFEKHVKDRAVLNALAEHQQRGGLLATTNYDLLLEFVTGLTSVTWRDPAAVERALRGDEPMVLHLHGAWRWVDSVVLGIKSYAEVARDSHAQAVLTTLRTGRTFVFVGCGAGLRDPNLGAFIKWTASVYAGSEYRHYRLCRDSEVEALKREHPDEQRIFPLSYGADHAALAPFLRSLLPSGAFAHIRPPPVQTHSGTEREPTPRRASPDETLTIPPPERWDAVLCTFFAGGFENHELYQFLAFATSPDIVNGLPGVDVPRSKFSFDAIELLKRHDACNHAFFDALRSVRPHRSAEIDAIRLGCIGTLEPHATPLRRESSIFPFADSSPDISDARALWERADGRASESLILILAEAYPDTRDARALWERAGGRASEVDNISRPRDLWQRLWNRSTQGATVRPAALLRAALQEIPNNPVLLYHLELLEAART